jgi:hypothetical protein
MRVEGKTMSRLLDKLIEELEFSGKETDRKLAEAILDAVESDNARLADDARDMVSQTAYNMAPKSLRVRAIREMNKELLRLAGANVKRQHQPDWLTEKYPH